MQEPPQQFRLSSKINQRKTLIPVVLNYMSKEQRLRFLHQVSKGSRSYLTQNRVLLSREKEQEMFDFVSSSAKERKFKALGGTIENSKLPE